MLLGGREHPVAGDGVPRLCQPPAFLRRQSRISRAQPIKPDSIEHHRASVKPYVSSMALSRVMVPIRASR